MPDGNAFGNANESRRRRVDVASDGTLKLLRVSDVMELVCVGVDGAERLGGGDGAIGLPLPSSINSMKSGMKRFPTSFEIEPRYRIEPRFSPSDKSDMNAFKDTQFAGGDGNYSVLSHLAGAHSIGEGFLGFLTMRESNALRGVCVEFREAVMDFPWMDAKSDIKGCLRAWRAAFPAARTVMYRGVLISSTRISSIFEAMRVHGCTL